MEDKQILFGINPIAAAIDAGTEITRVYVNREMLSPRIKLIINELRLRQIPVQYVPVQRLNKLVKEHHQGIIAVISPVEFQNIDVIIQNAFERGEAPLIVAFDGITDIHNAGAIARTALCAGAHALLLPMHGSSSVSPGAIKHSAGALLHIPICRTANLVQSLQMLRRSGLQCVVASEKFKQEYIDVDYTLPTVIVMGDEAEGISAEVLRIADDIVQIPIQGVVGSLNVSAAAAVMIYEAVRQRRAVDKLDL